MRLTKGVDYGARGIIYLARQPAGAVVLVGDIARREGVSETYLAKIFQDLARDGLVRSHRGARGGFSLARPAEEITLKHIVEAIEGPLAICSCLTSWEQCERKNACGLYPVLCDLQRQLTAIMGGTTLRQIVETERGLAV